MIVHHSWQLGLAGGWTRVPALGLEVMTRCNSVGQIRPQPGCIAQIGMAHGTLARQPGIGQEADAAVQITGHRHLLAIEQRYSIPALPVPGDGGGEHRIEISGHREGDR